MNPRLVFFLVLLSIGAHAQNWSTFLDSSRAVDWSGAGFTIPNYATPCATQPTLTANSAGAASANTTAIQNALASCDATHNVVNLPAGTYYIAGLTFGSQGYQVLRGAGSSAPANVCAAGSTCLIITANVGCSGIQAGICMLGPSYTYGGSASAQPPSGARQCSWTSGYSQGTTSITLNSCGSGNPGANGLSVGQQIILDQANDLTDNGGIYMCDSYTSSTAGGGSCTVNDGSPTNADGRRLAISGKTYTYSQKQIAIITSVSGSGTGPYTVGIAPGVYFNNIRPSQNPGAWFPGTLVNEGIENVYLDGTSTSVSTIQVAGCYQCWVKGISSYNAARAHVFANLSSHTVVRDSYFFQSQSHSEESYTVEFESTSADLVENNIMQQLTNPIMSGNTSGSVIGYNLAIGGVYVTSNYLQSSYASHNAGNDMDLYEGNNLLNIATDDTWGASNTETYFRNFLAAWQLQSTGPHYNTQSFIARSFSRAHNLIGNVLGQPGYHNTYESYATSTTGGVNQNSLGTSIYSLGWTGVAESTAGTCATPGCDAVVRPTLMRWGNWDVVNSATQWNSTEASPAAVAYVNANFTSSYFGSLARTLPASLYYGSTPSWWPSGKNWPPIGPDVTAGNVGTCSGTYNGAQAVSSSQCTGGALSTAWASHSTSIPAQDCYLSVMGGPPDGTGSMLSFDANTCYTGSAGTNPPAAPTGLSAVVN
jgi:hypothetical protein